jgi:hypothetical protein
MTRSVYEREIISPRLFALVGAFIIVLLLAIAYGAQSQGLAAPLAAPQTTGTPMFIKAGIFYTNGQFAKLLTFGEPMEDKHACMDELQHAIGAMVVGGKIPAGGTVIGACIPVPQLVKPTES